MKRGGVLIVVYSLLFAVGFLIWNSTQKAEPIFPASISVQKKAHYSATPDLPVFPPDLFLDRTDDKEEDVAPGLHEHAFAVVPRWILSWVTNRAFNIHDKEKPYRQPYPACLTPEKYIFFRSIRV